MVLVHNFQDILDASSNTSALNLPILKNNPLKVHFEESVVGCKVVYNGQPPVLPFAQSEEFHAKIAQWRRLTAVREGCKAVYEVTFDITDSNFQFQPGDTIGVIPHNRATEVDFIISHLDLTDRADLTYTLTVDQSQKAKIPIHVPVKATLRHVLTNCIDIRSVVKKLLILALSKHTKNEDERRVLEYLCSKEGCNTYTTHILNKNLCLLDLFAIFKTCKPPVEVILSNLPRLLPRPYSIVNCALKDHNIIKICFSVMDIGNNRRGLTTGRLEEAILNEKSSLENGFHDLSITEKNSCEYKVPIYLRKNISGFSMSDNLETPLILFGPGTGVAPFLGFLEEKEVNKMDSKVNCGKIWLFFGCRDPEIDFIYQKELNDFVRNGTLDKFITAFSRVENKGIKYIQDAVIQNGAEIVELIKNGASIYVCGDYKTMALQVKEALEKCLIKYDSMAQEEAKRFLCEMQNSKTYLVDIWS